MLNFLKSFSTIDNLVGLFIGKNSKKREIGFIVAAILMTLHLLGLIDQDTFLLAMEWDGVWLGIAFRAKIAKLAKSTVELKETQ